MGIIPQAPLRWALAIGLLFLAIFFIYREVAHIQAAVQFAREMKTDSEAKSLATQTAKATEEISGQIGHIQSATNEAVSAIRGIGLASMSERVHDHTFSKPKQLLEHVPGIEFVDFERPDECCGFGGSFSVTEEAVAAQMGYDKVEFMRKGGADYIVSSDMSCIMHLQGCSSRLGTNLKVLHIAQILNGVTQ